MIQRQEKRYVFFPDLENDFKQVLGSWDRARPRVLFKRLHVITIGAIHSYVSLCPNLRLQSKDPSLMNRYGVCVEKCPKQFETIEDYEDSGTKAIKGGQPMRRPDHPSWFLVET